MTSKDTIKICKIGNKFNLSEFASKIKPKRIRLSSENPNKLIKINYTPISVNKDFIMYMGDVYLHRDFFEKAISEKINNLIVLTSKEFNIVLDIAIEYNFLISVFEKKYPITKSIKFYTNISKTYRILCENIDAIYKLDINTGSAYSFYSKKYRYHLERKFRYKNSFDSAIFFACFPAYQEVFCMTEERPNKLVYALDFNSMYGACMEGEFADPKKMKFMICEDYNITLENAPIGFYQVKFCEAKDSNFLKIHPFKFSNYVRSTAFELRSGDSIEVFLPLSEIKFYSKFFKNTIFISGIYSSKSIKHPLINEVKKLYDEKLNDSYSNIPKICITSLASTTNPKRYFKKRFETIENSVYFFENFFHTATKDTLSIEEKLKFFTEHRLVKFLKYEKNYFYFEIFNYNSYESIFSIYASIVSNSRVKVLNLIQTLSELESFTLCYVNVDSVHFSIDEKDDEKFKCITKNIISNEMGNLKIEAKGTKGIWLDLGRYWIFKEKNIVKYSNFIFNYDGNSNPFLCNRAIKKVIKIDGYSFVKKYYTNIKNTFSFVKKINKKNMDNVSLTRYSFDEVFLPSVVHLVKLSEKITNISLKLSVFKKMATEKSSTKHANVPIC